MKHRDTGDLPGASAFLVVLIALVLAMLVLALLAAGGGTACR